MYLIHHHPFLPGCRFVRLVLGEYQLPHELAFEPFWEGRAAFAELNPALTVPVAQVSGGVVVVGEEPLMEYIEETRSAAEDGLRLMPQRPAERAEVRRLVAWFCRKFDEEVSGPIVHERLLKLEMPASLGGGAPDSAALRVARRNVKGHLHYIGHLLSDRHWLAGERMSHADLAAAAALSCVDYLGEVPWSDDDLARTWYARMKSRPSFRPLLTETARSVRPAPHYADLDF